MARVGTGQETTTHHTDPAEVVVTVGDVWTVHLLGASASGTVSEDGVTDLQKTVSQWKVMFYLQRNGVDVTDCTSAWAMYGAAEYSSPDVGTAEASLADGKMVCEVDAISGLAEYEATFANLAKVAGPKSGQPSWWGSMDFEVNEAPADNGPWSFASN
ncbi:MAG: hypothetical protein ACE5JR_09240 [Gemmatimonadota bacterium]